MKLLQGQKETEWKVVGETKSKEFEKGAATVVKCTRMCENCSLFEFKNTSCATRVPPQEGLVTPAAQSAVNENLQPSAPSGTILAAESSSPKVIALPGGPPPETD